MVVDAYIDWSPGVNCNEDTSLLLASARRSRLIENEMKRTGQTDFYKGEDFEKFGYARCEGGHRLPKARTQARQGRVVVGGPKGLPNKGVSSSRFLTKSSPPRSLSSLSSIESSFSSGGTSAGGIESEEEDEDLEHWMLYALEEEDLEGRMLYAHTSFEYAHTSFESSVSSGGICAGGIESKEDEEDLEGRMLYALGCVLEEEDPEGQTSTHIRQDSFDDERRGGLRKEAGHARPVISV